MSLVIGPRGLSRSKRITSKVWTLLHSANFEGGIVSPATGWTFGGDFGYTPRVWTGQNGGQAMRFPTQSEVGGSQNSYFRTQTILNSTYLTNQGITTDLRIDTDVKFPSLGGYAKQDATQGYSSSIGGWLTIGNGTRWHAFGIRSTNVFGVWLNSTAGDSAAPASGVLPTLTSAITPDIGNWRGIRYEIRLASSGFIKVTYNGVLMIDYTGDTRFNSGAAATMTAVYICHPAGGTASNNDLNYFGGIDNIITRK